MTTRRQFLMKAAALSGSLALSGCGSLLQSSSSSNGPIVFGVGGPFTGDNAEYGIIWKNAFNIALDEINARGGINGRKVQLVYEDTQSDPKQSVPVAQKFVSNDSVLAELGDFSSPASMAASPIYERAHLVQFGFTNSDPRFTLGGDYMFSTAATQKVSAAYMAQAAVNSLQGKKQAVLYLDTSWGQVTEGIYASNAKALGADIVVSKSYLSTEKDFRPLLLQVCAANPDLVALISYYNDAALIVQQAKEVGITSKLFAAGSAYSPSYLSEAGLEGFAAATLGGLGSLPGAVVGGLLLGIAEAFGVTWFGDAVRQFITFAVLIGVLWFKPGGLLGTFNPISQEPLTGTFFGGGKRLVFKYWQIAILIVLAVVVVPLLGSDYLLQVGVLVAIFAILALSLTLISGTAGQISIGQVGPLPSGPMSRLC
jgi:branched-chain amino acid transport system substrate-binding protein